uniref:Protein kinase domain-containing protein n=1 Tax=Onchocerca volvulus TaxID=6282 RepID=A0A8R1TMD2_ONCVO
MVEFNGGHSLSSSMSQIFEGHNRLPQIDDIVKSSNRTYRLIAILGEGGYGKVFHAIQDGKSYALKAEKYESSMLHIEIAVLKTALKKGAEHICELHDYGAVKPDFVFMVVTLLGKDLYKLRNEQPDRHFSISSAIRVGIHTCKAIEELHNCGFLSRDIKPGNYAVGLEINKQHRRFFLFDFGLARRYLDKNGKHQKSRGEIGWRGTTRYGSLKAHQKQDLGRRDDLESWFYCLVEITCGMLPWRHVVDRNIAYQGKMNVRNEERKEFLANCPKQYDSIMTLIDRLDFADQPNYDDIYKLLDQVREEHNVLMDAQYDWEEEESSIQQQLGNEEVSE